MNYRFFIIAGLIVSNLSFGQISAPKYSNEFLAIGVGARAMAMSNTQVASVNDVTSAYWNPAGLLGIEDKYEVGLMHAEYFAGIAKYDYAGFAARIDSNSVIAASLIRFGIDDIPDTRFLFDANGALNYDNVTFFSASDYAFLLSYARKSALIPGLQLGGNFKVVYRNIGLFANAWGFGLDGGAKFERNGWKLGANLRDVTGTFNAWTVNSDLLEDVFVQTGNEIPTNSIEVTLPRLIIGGARSFQISEKFGLLAGLDMDMTFDGKRNTLIKTGFTSIDPHLGIEADYKKIVFLRLGIGNIQELKDFDGSTSTSLQPNFGIGVKIKAITIDYALTDVGDVSEALFSNVFSVKFGINK